MVFGTVDTVAIFFGFQFFFQPPLWWSNSGQQTIYYLSIFFKKNMSFVLYKILKNINQVQVRGPRLKGPRSWALFLQAQACRATWSKVPHLSLLFLGRRNFKNKIIKPSRVYYQSCRFDKLGRKTRVDLIYIVVLIFFFKMPC